ncbi:unnamed protein product [Miscanthus lutarioriparius]|uniref:F-box domain-containing protein n=1 Tax=Miscanthus lutarioriparius TaxID=422564 RepID=A0A811QWT1_9POAL|nr:unnamed protein product [Miscanthus lutarioriparius]
MAMTTAAAPPPRRDLLCGPHADRRIVEWITGLNLLWRKLSRRREATRSQGPASNEVLANVFQRLSPRSIAACCAVCLKWSVLLSSQRFASLAADDGNASSTACFAGLDGANAGRARHQRGDTVTAATWFPPLAKRQHRRSKKRQAFRRMF